MPAYADNVLSVVLKQPQMKQKLSESLVDFLYLLLIREQKLGYPAFHHKPVAITNEHVAVFANAIVKVFDRFDTLNYASVSRSGLTVPFHIACRWTAEDIENNVHITYSFREPEETERDIKKFGYAWRGPLVIRGDAKFWQDLMHYSVGITFHHDVRRKHTQIIGATGAGKTTLLLQLIAEDVKSGASVIVLDSSNDFINTLMQSSIIPPERLRIIDPRDSVYYPLSLNMFDVPHAELSKLKKDVYIARMNNTISLLTFLFKSIMDEDMSGHQDGFLRYCCTLMIRIPGSTVLTLIDLLKNGTQKYQNHINKMSDVAQEFFRVGFPVPGDRKIRDEMGVTRRAIHRRLLWLLDNDVFRSFFTSPSNKFDISEVMDNGKVLLISTDATFLGREGSTFMGRYFISLLDQAALKRTTVSKSKRTPVYVYIDEAGDYFEKQSKMLESLLYKGRKSNVGLTLTQHDTGQIDQGVNRAIRGQANVRIVGSPDSGELYTLKRELRIDDIPEQPGRFAVYVKGTGRGFIAESKMGVIESAGKRSKKELNTIILENRERYCVDNETPPEPPKNPEIEPKSDETKGVPGGDMDDWNVL